jgi:hypothetical protein
MATYTMELREVIEHVFGTNLDPDEYEQEYKDFAYNKVIYGKLPVVPNYAEIGLGTYPIFDEAYRPILNGKIIDEYYTREIGTETIDNWLLMMRRKMDQIMPFYNQMYESTMLEFNPLLTMDIHTVGKVSSAGEEGVKASNTTTTETDSKGRAVQSQTPQTQLAGYEDYATGASDSVSESDVKSEGETDSNSTSKNEANTDNHVTGFQAIPSDLINKYRSTLISVDVMILQEIQDCFMMLLNNGDAYTSQGWYYNEYTY